MKVTILPPLLICFNNSLRDFPDEDEIYYSKEQESKEITNPEAGIQFSFINKTHDDEEYDETLTGTHDREHDDGTDATYNKFPNTGGACFYDETLNADEDTEASEYDGSMPALIRYP